MTTRAHARRLHALALLLAMSCAGAPPPTTTQPSAQQQAQAQAQARASLEQFSTSLARAGMSVPLPARLCDEPSRASAPAFDDDVDCVASPLAADASDVVRTYARAIVAKRLPGAPAARADALTDAWLTDDPQFASLARAVESEFDARRKDSKGGKAAKGRKRPPKERAGDRGGPADGGVAAAGAAADGGPGGGDDGDERDLSDAGPGGDGAGAGAGDGGPVPAGARVTLRERLIGTWLGTREGPLVPVHALCADGRWVTRYEAGDDVGDSFADDIDRVRGTWEAVEGDPPKVALIFGDGEREEGTISELTETSLEVTFAGAEPQRYTRRSKTASCD